MFRIRPLAAFIFVAGIVGCDAPSVEPKVQRLDDELHLFEVKYISDTCDPYTVRLFRTDSEGKAITTSPILIALPHGLQAPKDSIYAADGTTFQLKGYLYAPYTEQIGQRLDLVAWQPKLPYNYWNDGVPAQIETGNAAVPWFETSSDAGEQSFKLQKYNSCL